MKYIIMRAINRDKLSRGFIFKYLKSVQSWGLHSVPSAVQLCMHVGVRFLGHGVCSEAYLLSNRCVVRRGGMEQLRGVYFLKIILDIRRMRFRKRLINGWILVHPVADIEFHTVSTDAAAMHGCYLCRRKSHALTVGSW